MLILFIKHFMYIMDKYTKKVLLKNKEKPLMRYLTPTQSQIVLTLLFTAIIGHACLAPHFSFAATQGSLAATSSGSVAISVKKDVRVKVSSLSDLTQDAWEDGNGDVVLTNDVCIYSTRAMGGYKVAPLGSGANNAFTLSNGANTLAYELKWQDGGEGNLSAPTTSLTANTVSSNFQHASTTSPNCSAGKTARMEVRIGANNMSAASDGIYTGVLTLIVSPS
jgi:hypothetical protein